MHAILNGPFLVCPLTALSQMLDQPSRDRNDVPACLMYSLRSSSDVIESMPKSAANLIGATASPSTQCQSEWTFKNCSPLHIDDADLLHVK